MFVYVREVRVSLIERRKMGRCLRMSKTFKNTFCVHYLMISCIYMMYADTVTFLFPKKSPPCCRLVREMGCVPLSCFRVVCTSMEHRPPTVAIPTKENGSRVIAQ